MAIWVLGRVLKNTEPALAFSYPYSFSVYENEYENANFIFLENG